MRPRRHDDPSTLTDLTDTDASTAAATAPLTLGRLLEQLGSGVLDVVVAPAGLDVTVGHAAIHDPTESPRIERDDVVLAVGLRPTDQALRDLLQQAATADATAVVVKTRDTLPSELVSEAEANTVALVAATPDVTWSQLHALMRTAIASADNSSDGIGLPLGDLFALANAVSAMVGGPTTIEDPKSRVLAYSSLEDQIDEPRRQTILGRRVPDEWMKLLTSKGVFRQLWFTRDVVRVEDLSDQARPRMAIAVRAGDEVLGSIWVAEDKSPFDAAAEQALRQAAEIAALHIVRNRAGEDIERRIRAEQLRNIIEGRGPLDVLASRLGIEPGAAYVVVAFDLQTDHDAQIVLQRERALDLVALYCEAYRRHAASVPIGHTIYTLLPLADAGTEGVQRLVRGILERADQVLTVELRAAIGSGVTHLRDVARSRADADQVLRVLARHGDRQMASIDDVRAAAMLLELSDMVKDRPHLLVGNVDRLIEHDARHGSDYLPTLRAYLQSFGDLPAAAASLGVHPNTFRYRLRRLSELTGLNLTDPDERLAAELQIRLRDSAG